MALAAAMAVGWSLALSAHRLDEYLQAARIDAGTDAIVVDLDMTPGADVATAVASVMDRDGDGGLSPAEQSAYARDVLRDVTLHFDGAPLPLELASTIFPEFAAFRAGVGTVRLRFTARHARLTAGVHRIVFRNSHMPGRSVYLANALVPEDRSLTVDSQARDALQRGLAITYVAGGSPYGAAPAWLFACVAGLLAARWRLGASGRCAVLPTALRVREARHSTRV
jgi:hypothetical protein